MESRESVGDQGYIVYCDRTHPILVEFLGTSHRTESGYVINFYRALERLNLSTITINIGDIIDSEGPLFETPEEATLDYNLRCSG